MGNALRIAPLVAVLIVVCWPASSSASCVRFFDPETGRPVSQPCPQPTRTLNERGARVYANRALLNRYESWRADKPHRTLVCRKVAGSAAHWSCTARWSSPNGSRRARLVMVNAGRPHEPVVTPAR